MNIRHRNNDMCSRSRGQPVVTAGFVALAVVPMMVAVAIWAAPTLGPSPPEQLLLTVNRSHFCPLCEATAREQRAGKLIGNEQKLVSSIYNAALKRKARQILYDPYPSSE
ncbi:hypothetical protein NP493_16g02016 [Ridgeia piscesae]|uniref:Uncharacterized protein n=1 Tax=Ridgeia piscesae TaxID=27915 RepID=A0AAD9UL01_RIDPI|nr:hypothetical protein NP493_16g02016 [Ridgeia piscesae]